MGKPPQESKLDLQQIIETSIRRYWPLIIIGLLAVAVQWRVFSDWWTIWNETDSYYSHGILVPFISAFMIWTNRKKLAQTPIEHSWLGLVLLLAFIPVHLMGSIMGLRGLYALAFFLFAFGVLLFVFGRRITMIVLVPILFLITMIPFARGILDELTAQLQLLSATIATQFLKITTGYDIVQRGNAIVSSALPGEVLLVGAPCSGLRTLISLVTFSWFFVYVIDGKLWKKAVLFAMAFPLAIFINSLRITMIGYVGFWTYSTEAIHKFHDYSGYIGLVICFIILFGIAKLLKAGDFRTGESVLAEDVNKTGRNWPIGKSVYGVVTVSILVVAWVLGIFANPVYDLPKGKLDRASIPASFGEWNSEKIPIDDTTNEILGKGDLLNLVYTHQTSGRQVQVFLDASLCRSAFHNPHICLQGGGGEIANDSDLVIEFTEPRPITVKAAALNVSNNYGATLIIHWYMLKDRSIQRTHNLDSIIREHNIDDFKRIMANPLKMQDVKNDILSRQFTWYRFAIELYDEEMDKKFLIDFIKEFVANNPSFGK